MTDNKQNARKQAQRRARQRKQRNRRIALTACLMIAVMVASIGGTLAWLTDQTTPVTNTFTVADIAIDLYETKNPDGNTVDADNDGNPDHITEWKPQIIPGKTYAKNPVVEVIRTDTDVDIYLFVKFEEGSKNGDYLTYTSKLTSANGWTELTSGSNVWYRVVSKDVANPKYELLEGNDTFTDGYVTVKNTVDKEAASNEADIAANVKLVYTAYAIQYDGFENDPAAAWARLQDASTTNTNP